MLGLRWLRWLEARLLLLLDGKGDVERGDGLYRVARHRDRVTEARFRDFHPEQSLLWLWEEGDSANRWNHCVSEGESGTELSARER